MQNVPKESGMKRSLLFLFLPLFATLLLAAPSLEMFERFPDKEGGPDTRGAIWYDQNKHTIFVADHGKGLWKIDECGEEYGQTTNQDNGIWDISQEGDHLYAVGKNGLYIYDREGEYLNSLNGIQGEGIYVKEGYGYIVNEKGGITIVNLKDTEHPFVIDTVMTGEQFSQIRGGEVTLSSESGDEQKQKLLYVTSLDGKLYLFEISGSTLKYKDDLALFSTGTEARKLFVGKKELVYINSNYGELAIVKLDKESLTLKKIGAWKSSENHGWLNDTRIYLAAHDGFCFMGMKGARNVPKIAIRDANGTYQEDNLTMHIDNAGDKKLFFVKVSNEDDSRILSTRLSASKAEDGWEYRYFDGDMEITDKITSAEGYILYNMNPGISREIRLVVKALKESARDVVITFRASNKESKVVCGRAIEEKSVQAVITFDGAPEPFTCNGNAYIFTSHDSKNNPTDVYLTDIVSGNFDKVAEDINPTNINAIGYNITDNFLWGYDKVTEEVKRIDKNYRIKAYKVTGLPEYGYHAGDVSKEGILYLFTRYYDDGKKIYKVDVNPASANYLQMVGEIELSQKIYTSDFAFHPKDNKIYFAGNSDLFRIDPDSGKVDNLGDLGLGRNNIFVGTFFDAPGYLYIQQNSGDVYRIDLTDPIHPDSRAKLFSKFDVTSYSDGARCPNAPVDTPPPPENSECIAAFPGAVSSTNDEIQINVDTKIYGTTDHTLITKQLSTSKRVTCDDAPCKKSNTLAKKINFDLLLGDGKDGDQILSDNKTLTISSDKSYKKFQTGQHNVITINGDITIRSQSDFYINQATKININGNVVIYADKFDSNQAGIFDINGSLKIITNVFYLNSGNRLQNIPKPESFVVLAKDIVDINSQVNFKGLFYSGGDIQINNNTKITGALTGNYIDINNHSLINYDADAVKNYCGTVESNKTTSSHFNVWDIDESIDHPVIKTKVVGEDINLTFASLNETGTAFKESEARNIKVALFSPSEQLTIWHSLALETATHMNVTFKPEDFAYYHHQNKAFKAVKVFIKYEDKNGTSNIATSTDSFAIRPKSYRLSLSPTGDINASETFHLKLEAVGADNKRVLNYEENENVYTIGATEIKPGCSTGTLSVAKKPFSAGVAQNIEASYDNVGRVDIAVREQNGSEFAAIDRSDTNISIRLIGDTKIAAVKFRPKNFALSWRLKNFNEEEYTYYSNDLEKMSAKLLLSITAKSAGHTTTTNYKEGCYSRDVDLTIRFETNTTLSQPMTLLAKTLSGAESQKDIDVPSSTDITLHIDKSAFENGENNETVMINFKREANKVREPVRLVVDEVGVKDSDAVGGTAATASGGEDMADFYYVRAHTPDWQGVGKEIEAKIFYEAYCKKCDKRYFHLEGRAESTDSVFWYMLPVGMGCDFSSTLTLRKTAGAAAAKIDRQRIRLSAPKTPYINVVDYIPESYLRFNPFNASVTQHHFKVRFTTGSSKWAGRGKQGATVDAKVSKRDNSMKLEW